MDVENNAASTPAQEAQPQEINLSTFTREQRQAWRETGELPEPPKQSAESAPAKEAQKSSEAEGDKPNAETGSESDPDKQSQEQPHKGSAAEKRIKQLLARTKELEAQLAAGKKPDEKQAESSPAKPAEQPKPVEVPLTRPRPVAPKLDDVDKDGKAKYATYEEFDAAKDQYTEDLADWKAEQRVAKFQREQAEKAATQALSKQLNDARTRYADADTVIFPTGKALHEDAAIPAAVKATIEDSPVYIDLLYVIGSDKAEMAEFVNLARDNPRAALAKVFEYERLVQAELGKGKEVKKPEAEAKSGDKKEAPVKPETKAPKPPSEVGGRNVDTEDPDVAVARSGSLTRDAKAQWTKSYTGRHK